MADGSGATSFVRLRLDIGYDGSGFSGWAVQPGRRTVAGVLGEALATLLRAPVPIVVAGRTDAGVHASGQVAHIDVERGALAGLAPRRPPTADPLQAALTGLRRRLAGLLPPEVRVMAVSPAPEGFNARFSALRRHYRYRLLSSDWGIPPLTGPGTTWWRRPLDAAAMQQAAAGLVGLHDFAAYCKPREGATTVRDLQSLTVTSSQVATDRGTWYGAELVAIEVTADAFCHSMVRSLVGALIAVGEGRSPVARPGELLQARARTAEIAVAPAGGLTLIGVDYPPDAELASRAEQTRALRCDSGR